MSQLGASQLARKVSCSDSTKVRLEVSPLGLEPRTGCVRDNPLWQTYASRTRPPGAVLNLVFRFPAAPDAASSSPKFGKIRDLGCQMGVKPVDHTFYGIC